MHKTRLFAAVVLSLFSGAMVACDDGDDDDEDYEATLTAAAERPNPPTSSATGTANLVLEDRVLTVTVDVTGQTTSNITMAHIHGPATTETNAGIVLDFVPAMTTSGTIGTRTGRIVSASFDLDNLVVSSTGVLRVAADELINMLNTGQAYVNVHTQNNQGGEIRGQIRRD